MPKYCGLCGIHLSGLVAQPGELMLCLACKEKFMKANDKSLKNLKESKTGDKKA